MKFQVLVQFKDDGKVYEVGNSHDGAVCGISDARLDAYQKAGIVHIDGKDDQALTTTPVQLAPEDVTIVGA